MHQTVDIRVRGARRNFIDQASEAEHARQLADFRAAIPKNVRFVVGPGTVVEGKAGKTFGPGSPISVTDLEGEAGWPSQPNARAPWQQFEELVHQERIVENYSFVPPDDATP